MKIEKIYVNKPIKREQIICTVEQYNVLLEQLRHDRLDYRNYKVLEPDEEKEKLCFKKIQYDLDKIALTLFVATCLDLKKKRNGNNSC